MSFLFSSIYLENVLGHSHVDLLVRFFFHYKYKSVNHKVCITIGDFDG